MSKLFDFIASKVDDAELYTKKDDILMIEVKQGKISAVDGKNVLGLSLRMNKDGKPGTAVSSDFEDKTIVERAITSSQYKSGSCYKFKNVKSTIENCFDQTLYDMSSEALIKEAESLAHRLKAINEAITFMISFERSISHVTIENTEGLEDAYKKTSLKVSIASMSESGFVQGMYTEAYAKYFTVSDEKLNEIVHRHLISNNVVKVPTKHMPVVFSGRAMGALMTRLLAGVNGEFVAKGVSPLEDKIGKLVTSPILNIYDDGLLDAGYGTLKFDDEGTPAHRTSIIEEGVLKQFLSSVSTEDKLGVKATGNALKKTMFSKEIEDQPAIDSTNFLVSPGESLDTDIIKSIDYGIYVDSVMGTHTGNIPAGEYALNVSIGYLIENGKLVGKIADTMVSGNIYEDLMKVKAVGKHLELMNVVFYPMGYSPMVLFEDINVVGSQ